MGWYGSVGAGGGSGVNSGVADRCERAGVGWAVVMQVCRCGVSGSGGDGVGLPWC